ncbi:MAG: glycosyltransferase [Flavobacteriaceae bacterium]|nr:glycosyltransferase [Flavobacteriaceae bacterium]
MKKILIAPLNWGLGHATRCIPIIKALIANNFEPILAGDGDALTLLQKEFPQLTSYQLPSYNIKYSKSNNLKTKLFLSLPKILKAVKQEKKLVDNLVSKEGLSGIISDNRFGVRSTKIPSVYITHQLNVLSGNTTSITSKLHQKIISKFDECWVPDTMCESNLSGELSKVKNEKLKVKFIGALSRFEKQYAIKKHDLLIVLSGPEPQRSILEEKLLVQLKETNKKTVFVRGVITKEKLPSVNNNITIVNYMLSKQLEQTINESEVVLARSGYSTIMDLAKLEKKVFFIPTPGQFEQEYLALRMDKLNIVPFAHQDDFKLKMLEKVNNYKGFENTVNKGLDSGLFNLFQQC